MFSLTQTVKTKVFVESNESDSCSVSALHLWLSSEGGGHDGRDGSSSPGSADRSLVGVSQGGLRAAYCS